MSAGPLWLNLRTEVPALIAATILLDGLRHLRYFIAGAEEEHFGRASDKLRVTQPAVSKIIADLEAPGCA
jgi:hypothetical protein